MKKIVYSVLREDSGCSVEKILRQEMGLSLHQIKSAKYRQNGICVNGIRTRITTIVREGDLLEVQLEPEEDSNQVEAVSGEIDILYEDEDLLLINKPAGIAVHPAHGHYRDTLANYVKYYLLQKGWNVPVRAVGRLDKDTSGIVIFAKNQVAAARLSQKSGNKKTGTVEKEYLAIVRGHLKEKQGCMEAPIKKKDGALNCMEVSEKGQFARTHYRVIEEFPSGSLVSLKLDTGRTHQIRVHMAYLGHPLFGDPIYGIENQEKQLKRAALHCAKVRIIQPFTGERIEAEAALPEDLELLLK